MANMTDRVGFDDVMNGFSVYMDESTPEQPVYYSVWAKDRLKFICKSDNVDDATKLFEDNISVWQRNGTTGQLEVRFHDYMPTNRLSNKSEYFGSFTFALHEKGSGYEYRQQAQQPVQQPQRSGSPIQQLIADIAALEQLKQVLGVGGVPMGATVTEVEPEKTIYDRIEQLATLPIFEGLITAAAKKVGLDMSEFESRAAMSGDVKGVDTEEIVGTLTEQETYRLQRALARLMKGEKDFVSLMEKLAHLKENNKMKWEMAKSML